MKTELALTFAAILALAAPGAGHAGESQTTAQTVRHYVLNVDGMT